MIIYHGSYMEIVRPDLKHSRPNVDFGLGFYSTPIYDQAVKWCGKFMRAAVKMALCHVMNLMRQHMISKSIKI